MITTWQILNTKKLNANGLVIEVSYGCTVELGNLKDSVIQQLQLTGDPSEPGFIPYEQLTEAIVLDWVKTALGDAQVNLIETTLQNRVLGIKASIETATESNGLPWL